MKHTIIKRIISLLVAATVMFCLAGNAFANTTAKKFSVDSIVSQYGGDQADELRSLINKYIIMYEDSASQQRFLGLVAQKLAAGTPADHIMMMNIRQVMAGFPEGSLPSGDAQTTRGSDGEIRANTGGVRPKIAVGHNHTVYLKHDGTVVTWGKYVLDAETTAGEDTEVDVNSTGQLMAIPNLTDVIEVAAGGGSALALKSDGTVWAWGVNTRGQLGDGTTTNQITPVQVKQDDEYLTNVTAIAMGPYNGAAIKSDGSVVTWGDGLSGQLGIGIQTTYYPRAIRVVDVGGDGYLDNITSIAIGQKHMLALKSDGTLVAWGDNTSGQLGNNSLLSSAFPVQVKNPSGDNGLGGIKKIATGHNHNLALATNGSVYAWGDNSDGQLGNNTTLNSNKPVQVLDFDNDEYLKNVVEIAAGNGHSSVKRSNGKVSVWGRWHFSDEELSSHIPIELNNITMVSHLYSGANHLIAQKADGTVWGIGANDSYQLADAVPNEPDATWYKIYTPTAFIVDVSASPMNSIALASNGTLYACGLNSVGQLGIGTDNSATTSTLVVDSTGTGALNNIVAIYSDWYNTLALRADGTVWAWGTNECGELGDGDIYNHSNKPVQVKGENGVGVLENIIDITMYDYYCRAIKDDGTVWEWGGIYAVYDQYPHQITGEDTDCPMEGVVKISGNMVLKADGTVWTTGDNSYGQLGIGTIANTEIDTYVQVKGVDGVGVLENIVDITGGLANVAVAADGSVYAWGNNQYGTCGDNTTINRSTPVRVLGVNDMGYLTGVSRVISGNTYFFAITSSGQLVGWGDNWHGQFGTGSTNNQYNYPVYVYNTGAIFADEYGDTIATAEELVPNRAINGNLYGTRDCDYFSFVFHGEIGAIIDLTSELDKVSFSVYDSQQQYVSPGVGSGGRYILTNNERYYIQVTQSYSLPSDYTLHVDFIENNLDNTFATARTIAPNKTIIDNLYGSNDLDYFSFSSGENIAASLAVTAQNGIIFSVFNDQQQAISVNSNGYYPLESNKQYYIRLSPSHSAVTKYTLRLRLFQDNAGSTLNSAQELYPNDHQQFQSSGSIDYIGDIDMFKFTVSEAGTYYLSTTGNCDTFGTLKSANNTTIESANAGGEGDNFSIDHKLEAGTYYLEVKANTQTTGEYILYIEKPLEITYINAITSTNTIVD